MMTHFSCPVPCVFLCFQSQIKKSSVRLAVKKLKNCHTIFGSPLYVFALIYLHFEITYDVRQIHNIRSKMVSVLREKFAHLNLTFSIGGQISFDVSVQQPHCSYQ